MKPTILDLELFPSGMFHVLILEMADYEVLRATDDDEAFDILRTKHVHLVAEARMSHERFWRTTVPPQSGETVNANQVGSETYPVDPSRTTFIRSVLKRVFMR
jgi:hypothetical protein